MDNQYTTLLEELRDKKIIVFGCGRYFKEFLLRYPSLAGEIALILDNHPQSDIYTYDKFCIPVVYPTEISRFDLSYYIMVFCAESWKEMKDQFDVLAGQEYIFFHYPLNIDYRRDRPLAIFHRIVVPAVEILKEYSVMEKAVELLGIEGESIIQECLINGMIHAIPRLTVALTPKCSLRCRECNNLMWRFTDHSDLQAEKIISSLGNVIDAMDLIPCIELIGGEPFAAGNLNYVLDFLLEQKKVMVVEITTNATIMPSVETLNRLKNQKVYVHVSSYGHVVDQRRFISCMQENNIQYRLLEFQNQWVSTGGIEKRNRDADELMYQYYQCISGNLCKTLWEDRLYPCARAASLAALGIMTDCPYIDCLQKEGIRERLYSFYLVPSCGPCDYCDVAVADPVYVEPAVQLGRSEDI